MKVVKKGRTQKGWSKEFKCTGTGNEGGGCGAKLLVEHGDLFTTHSSHYDGSNDIYITFECCQCGVLTDTKDNIGSHRDIPNQKDWKKMRDKSKKPIIIELTKGDISKIVGGGRVDHQIVSGKFNNAPLLDIEIVAEDQPDRKDFSELMDEAIAEEPEEPPPANNDPHNQAWLMNAECSKCGRVYCDCETKY